MQVWLIGNYVIPYLLRQHGFTCERRVILGSVHTDWYTTNCPIPTDGDYTLPDGTVIQGCGGIELRIKNKEEIVLPRD